MTSKKNNKGKPKNDRSKKQYLIDEIKVDDTWRMFRILAELTDGFEELADIGPAVSIFGSARTLPGAPMYDLTIEIARKLSDAGFAVISHWLPFLVLSVYFGALADRHDCRKLIQIAQGGRVPLPITDEQLKRLLIQLEGQQKKREISIRRV